jgi:hypothetical protein
MTSQHKVDTKIPIKPEWFLGMGGLFEHTYAGRITKIAEIF